MLTKAPRGTKDITPKDAYKWNYVENKFREICSLFGYEEMRTPVFEHTELFKRKCRGYYRYSTKRNVLIYR